jgi:hypothetical protein
LQTTEANILARPLKAYFDGGMGYAADYFTLLYCDDELKEMVFSVSLRTHPSNRE